MLQIESLSRCHTLQPMRTSGGCPLVSWSHVTNVMQSASLLFFFCTLERCSRIELAKEGMLNNHSKSFCRLSGDFIFL